MKRSLIGFSACRNCDGIQRSSSQTTEVKTSPWEGDVTEYTVSEELTFSSGKAEFEQEVSSIVFDQLRSPAPSSRLTYKIQEWRECCSSSVYQTRMFAGLQMTVLIESLT